MWGFFLSVFLLVINWLEEGIILMVVFFCCICTWHFLLLFGWSMGEENGKKENFFFTSTNARWCKVFKCEFSMASFLHGWWEPVEKTITRLKMGKFHLLSKKCITPHNCELHKYTKTKKIMIWNYSEDVRIFLQRTQFMFIIKRIVGVFKN